MAEWEVKVQPCPVCGSRSTRALGAQVGDVLVFGWCCAKPACAAYFDAALLRVKFPTDPATWCVWLTNNDGPDVWRTLGATAPTPCPRCRSYPCRCPVER